MKKSKSTQQKYQPVGWQLNPAMLTSEKVSYWKNGIMLTAQMPNATAQEKVNSGTAFVISSGAIGAMVDGHSEA